VFRRKKSKKQKEPDYSKLPVLPNDLAQYVQETTGLKPKELVKLFESLNRIDQSIPVTRRHPVAGKNISKEVRGKEGRMSMEEAVDYEVKRAESKSIKESRLRELTDIETDDLFEREDINDEIYPKRLSPKDMVRYIGTAQERLEALDRLRARQSKVFLPREEALLDVLTSIKKYEVARLARKIAEQQRESVAGKTLEELKAEHEARLRKLKGEPEPETPEQTQERLLQEEQQRIADETAAAEEAARILDGFGKDNHTLADEAGMLVKENPDAAAAVVQQWLGNPTSNEK
jgi:hypothetical protein